MSMQDIINVIRKKQDKNVYIGQGEFIDFKCKLNKPANNSDIESFEKSIKFKIPSDYKEFLLQSNGLMFFDSGDFEIFDLQTVLDITPSVDYINSVYIIGSFLQDYIVIDSRKISTEKYLYVGPQILSDRFISLEHNFKELLERLLITNVQKYWDWNTNVEYHNFSK